MRYLRVSFIILAVSLSAAACLDADSFTDKDTALQQVQVAEGWSRPVLLGAPINTAGWEDGAYITADGSQLYFAYFQGDLINFVGAGLKNFERYQRGPTRGDRPGFLDVLVSQRQGDIWSEPARFRYAEDFFAEGGVVISTDGSLNGTWYNSGKQQQPPYHNDIFVNGIRLPAPVNTPADENDPHFINGELFFWKPGNGATKEDIWMANNIGGDPQKWTAPVRLAAPINTSATEMQPFLAPSGNLYFSTGRGNQRLSIYVSARRGPNEWSEPQPIMTVSGTQSDIMAIGEPTLTADEQTLYFVIIFNRDDVLDCDIAKITRTSASETQAPAPISTQSTTPTITQQPKSTSPSPKTNTSSAGSSSIAPETWAGIGSTTSVTVKDADGAQDRRAAVWAYTMSVNPLPILYTPPGPHMKPGDTGLGVRLRSDQDTTVALAVKESSGAQYDSRIELPKGAWISREILWNTFKLQDNNKDPNGHLNPTQIIQILFVDIGGFMGKKGSNQLWIDDVWRIGSSGNPSEVEAAEFPQSLTITKPPSTSTRPVTAQRVNMGTGFWPTNMTSDYQERWFALTRESGATILAIQKGDPFAELAKDDLANYNTILNQWLERGRGSGMHMKTYLGLEPFTGDRKQLDTPPAWHDAVLPRITDPAWQQAFLDVAMRNVMRHHPDYFNPCVEVNIWYATVSPQEWQAFRDLYSRLYTQVKTVSPNTTMFCSIQYDLLSGQMFGNSASQWELLDDPSKALPNQDVLGLSTYPHGDRYDQWYDGLRGRKTPPIFVAEIGFISSDASPASPKFAEEQQAFVVALPRLFRGLPLHSLVWLTLADVHRQTVPGLPDWLYVQGLMDTNLQPKPAWNAWQQVRFD